jgi:hypothetical protein
MCKKQTRNPVQKKTCHKPDRDTQSRVAVRAAVGLEGRKRDVLKWHDRGSGAFMDSCCVIIQGTMSG